MTASKLDRLVADAKAAETAPIPADMVPLTQIQVTQDDRVVRAYYFCGTMQWFGLDEEIPDGATPLYVKAV